MHQAAFVDAMADAEGNVPLAGQVRLGERVRGLEERVERDNVVRIAMHEQDRRRRPVLVARRRLGEMVGADQRAGIAEHAGRRARPTQPRVQGHHGALAEADERERGFVEAEFREFGVEERVERGPRLVEAGPAFGRIAHGQREPLPAGGRHGAEFRRVRSDE